uniref:Uncharacterized protein n=1 Tax=Salix viminalis TaxID=40686 RepID=A0A6N2LNJ5_SALVM
MEKENKSKQIPKFPRRENPENKEFQETKSFSGNSSITNHHSIADEPMDTIHRLDCSTVNCLAIRD